VRWEKEGKQEGENKRKRRESAAVHIGQKGAWRWVEEEAKCKKSRVASLTA
jgi:hypothetical protein